MSCPRVIGGEATHSGDLSDRARAARLAGVRLVSFRDETGATAVGRLDGEQVVVLQAPSMLDWLRGHGHEEAGTSRMLDDVQLLAPVPEPPSVRDFYAYEGHVATGWQRRGGEVPPAWYAAPAFYFSNPSCIVGPGEEVRRPAVTRMLDFELEIAAVIGADGAIAGFTLLNDLSARDVQRDEVSVGLGPAKAKDFATALGPWLVTPDELPLLEGRLQLEATVAVNGSQITRTHAGEQHFSWDQIVAHAARDTRLRAGDVLGSGTLNRGCLLELGPLPGDRWLEPGDTVTLTADGLGSLATPIV
jgi:fumarylacetoacetate (FAA) hydrolase